MVKDGMDHQLDVKAVVHPVGVVGLSPSRTLWTVQVMRGLAALMVVIGHSQSAVAGIVVAGPGSFARSTLVPWGAGVDLFFVISGFIMVHASARLFGDVGARNEFLRRRLIRIAPLYWLAATIFLALLAAAALKGGDPFPTARAIVASYAFFPADTYGDGRFFPVFDVGWTLNYEMFFYALFAVVVAWPRNTALTAIGILLVALVALGVFAPERSAAWFWTRPIILDFGLGVMVGSLVAARVAMPGTVRAIVAVAAVTMLLADPAHVFDGAAGTTVTNSWPRVFLAGMPAAAVLAAALLGPEPPMPRIALPFTRIGDASYSLYLFHPFALIGMEKVAQKLPFVDAAPGSLLVVCTVAAALGLAFAAWRWIERPLIAALASPAPTRPSLPVAR